MMAHFDGLTLDEVNRFLQALGDGGFDIELIREVAARPRLAEFAAKVVRRRIAGDVRRREADVAWQPSDYVVVDERLARIVAAEPSEALAKEKAIAAGVLNPQPIPATQLRR
jgi:hypothetical protein